MERIATEPVQRKQDAETNRCAAAKPPAARNLFHNRIGKRKCATLCLLEESMCGLQDNSRMRVTRRGAGYCNAVMDAQCDTQTIESRAKVRSASGNANSNFLHRKYSASSGQPRFPIVVKALFQQCPHVKLHAIRIRQRVGDRQAAGYPDSSNTDANGKPIHCTAPISKYAVGAPE